MIKRCIQAGLVGVLLAASFFIPLRNVPSAFAATGVFIPFGGRIITMTPCNEGFLLYLGPPRPIPVLVPYGLTYQRNVFRPGGLVLGLGAGFSPCTVGPTVIGGGLLVVRGPIIIFVGTSF